MPRFRVYVKKQVRLQGISFNQYNMLKLGTVGLATVKNRVDSVKNSTDSVAKPLTKGYAIRKARITRAKSVRDLRLSGRMLDNFQVRQVSDNAAYSSMTTRHARAAAGVNNRIEKWIAFSPADVKNTIKSAYLIFEESVRKMVIQRWMNT